MLSLRWAGIDREPAAVIQRDTLPRVAEREYVWSEEGLADAARNKVGLDEVEQALYAPAGLRFERHIGDVLLVVMGMADSARVIAVLCDRVMRRTSPYCRGTLGCRTPIAATCAW